MIINPEPKEIYFGALENGECFLYGGSLYMKIDTLFPGGLDSFNAVGLSDGIAVNSFDDHTKVTEVIAIVSIL